MNSRNFAFLLAFMAAIIYGISFTVAKDVMPLFIKPYGFILLRVICATILFWTAGFFIEKEKISNKDFVKIFLASIFGVALNMLAFFKGLSMTNPISASVIMVTAPILVLIFSIFFLREKATKKILAGIFIGMLGAIVLIAYEQDIGASTNAGIGNLLVFINAASYGLYLIIVKSLTSKYNPLAFAKWIYLFGLILVIPFGYTELTEVNWVSLPIEATYKIGFVVIFTTFIAYLFNLFAIRKLKPTTLSIFIYLQPVIASTYALIVGSDSLNLLKIIATLLIFIGVFLVSRKPKVRIP